jgi:ABC-type uncharacterized transport system ATPase subunit
MNGNHLKLKKLEISGYKSINGEGQSIQFGDVTVLLGANGAVKATWFPFSSY